MKINILYLIALFMLIGCSSGQKEKNVNNKELKNVLFIVSDDMRTELGVYGYSHMHTPNIDKLASQGRVFLQAHVQEAICNPSRMSFLTGLRPDEIKVYSNRDHFRSQVPEATTIPQHFKENGYRSQAIGKIFHGGMDDPFAWSLEPVKASHPKYGPKTQAEADSAKESLRNAGQLQRRYLELDEDGLPIRQIREKGVEFHSISWEAPDVDPFYFSDGKNCQYAMQTLDTLAQTKEPFFLAVGFSKPHTPYVAPARFFDFYELDTLPENIIQKPMNAPSWAFPGAKELEEYRDIEDDEKIPLIKQRELRRAYRACVSYVDFLIGELLSKLKETGLDKNTIVVFIGDHGYHLGEQSIWTKQTNFDWGTKAPLIVKVPEQNSPGKQTHSFVEFIDILPTLTELAGLPEPKMFSGKSFTSVIENEENTHKDYVFSQYPRKKNGKKAMGYTVRNPDWRYTVWIDRETNQMLTEELYDLKNHSFEKINLASDDKYNDKLAELKNILSSGLNLNI